MRKKLKLDVDRLEVETFKTAQSPAGGGTVRGHGYTEGYTCQPCTDWMSCPNTCDVTCSPACEDTFWRSCWWSCEC